MSKFSTTLLAAFFFVMASASLSAQGLIDGFFQPKGKGSATLSYTRSTFDEFYAGEMKMPAVPVHNSIDQNIINFYANYGLTDKLTVIANVPYFSASGNGEPDPINGFREVDGLQDISLALKFMPFSADLGGAQLSGIVSAGASLPGDYEPNGILSIGYGAFTTDLTGGLHLQTGSGFFATGLFNYSLRGEADNNGGGEDFDVPNATHLTGKVGYAGGGFYAEAWVRRQSTSDEGIDITDADFGGRFPLTKVDFTVVGGSVYVPVGSVLGLSAAYGTIVSGRNVGDASYFSLGATINFGGVGSSSSSTGTRN